MENEKPINPTGMNAPDFLIESIPNAVHSSAPHSRQNPWLAPVMPLIVSLAATLFCWWAAGLSLGLFLGGFVLAALLIGPFIVAEETWLGRALVGVAVVHSVAGIWLFALVRADYELGPWLACYLTLAAWSLGIAGVTLFLQQILRLGRVGSGAIVTCLALAWLSWPIWLSPALHGDTGNQIAAWLVPAHPLFAANAVLRERFGVWAEHGIAYNLTTLGDDVMYSLPPNVYRCVALHAGMGIACCGIARLVLRKKSAKTA